VLERQVVQDSKRVIAILPTEKGGVERGVSPRGVSKERMLNPERR
jgi:hypothetical protein